MQRVELGSQLLLITRIRIKLTCGLSFCQLFQVKEPLLTDPERRNKDCQECGMESVTTALVKFSNFFTQVYQGEDWYIHYPRFTPYAPDENQLRISGDKINN